MAQAISTGTFCEAKWVVDPVAGQGSHTTIATAITSASSGDTIFIRPGTYTENLTLKAGVNLTGFSCDGGASGQGNNITPNVIIKGTCTISFTGSATYSGIQFLTNSAAAIATSGSNASNVVFINCSVYANDATAITMNASSTAITFISCVMNSTSTNLLFAETTSSGCVWQNCIIRLSGTAGASTVAVSNMSFTSCSVTGLTITTATTGMVNINNCVWSYAATTLLTMAGTGTSNINNSEFESTSASTFSIGSGCTLNLYNSIVNSSNTNAITGLGILKYGAVTFSGSSSTVNTTTQTPVVFSPGTLKLTGQGTAFTPSLAFGGSSTGITYAAQTGEYTQIGNLVFFYVNIQLTSKGAQTGAATITGLPVTTNGSNQVIAIGYWSALTLTALYTDVGAYNNANSTVLNLIQSGSTQSTTALADTNFANGSAVIFNGFYFTT